MSKNLLYKHIGRQLKPETSLDAIRAYMISDGKEGIVLTEDQQRQKMIIDFADDQIRSKQGILNRYAIAQIISNRFDITHRSAQKYITLAEDLYSTSAPLNKRYKIQLRIEKCEEIIERLIQVGDYELAEKWEKRLKDYIELYPELKLKRTRRTVIYNIPGLTITEEMSVESAVNILKQETESDHE
jgi:hypothetical protein